MKTISKKVFLSAVLVALLAGPAMADVTVTLGTTGNPDFPYSPYRIKVVNDVDGVTGYADGSSFLTFCVERTVGIGSNPYSATVDEEIMYFRTTDGQDNPLEVALNEATQKIYSAFLNGGGKIADGVGGYFAANDIQQEIWYHQAINTGVDHGILGVLSDTTGWEDVKVLNLWGQGQAYNADSDFQSMLIRPVPAPGAILLASMGVSVVGWLRRRQSL